MDEERDLYRICYTNGSDEERAGVVFAIYDIRDYHIEECYGEKSISLFGKAEEFKGMRLCIETGNNYIPYLYSYIHVNGEEGNSKRQNLGKEADRLISELEPIFGLKPSGRKKIYSGIRR